LPTVFDYHEQIVAIVSACSPPSFIVNLLSLSQLLEQVSCHRGKLRDYVRSLVKTYIDIEVRKAPPVIFKNMENGETILGNEKPSAITARYVSRLLDDLHFLDRFSHNDEDKVYLFPLNPHLSLIPVNAGVIDRRPQFPNAKYGCYPGLRNAGVAVRAQSFTDPKTG
jgi:hypothetical protein